MKWEYACLVKFTQSGGPGQPGIRKPLCQFELPNGVK